MNQIPVLPYINTAELLRKYGLRPDKSLGQNFLQDDSALRRIVEIAEIAPDDTVLEIGPGLGSLTRYLAIVAKRVVAVELDGDLIPILKKELEGGKNITFIHGDILKLNVSELIKAEDYLVVANIPYYITSAIIRHLLEGSPRPRRIVLTVQKEVAQRICAQAGDMSLLALSVQAFGKPSIKDIIPASAFFPSPNVDSAIIQMEIFPQPVIQVSDLDLFFRLAKAGFSQKRKTLRNSLSGGLSISTQEAEQLLGSAQIDPKRRAETLSLEEWKSLTEEARDLTIISDRYD